MTEENSGNNTEETTRDVIDISVENLKHENLKLKAEVDSLKGLLKSASKELTDAKSFLEQNERGKIRDQLRTMGCTYGVEELDNMSLDELDQLKQHYRFYNPPVFKSGADVSKQRKSMYDSLDEIYTPLTERKRSLQEA